MRAIGRATGQGISRLDEALKHTEHDDGAQEALRSAGEALGRAASMVLNLVNPSHLVLYAPEALLHASGKGALFMFEMERALKQYSFSTTKECRIVPRVWSADYAAVGAALGALHAKG